jgi:2-isopropylmalate synthase
MDINRKMRLFHMLKEIGFEEMAIGNPASKEENRIFLKRLNEDRLLFKDIFFQVDMGYEMDRIEQSIPMLTELPKTIIQLELPLSNQFADILIGKTGKQLVDYAKKAAKSVKQQVENYLSHNEVKLSLALEDFMAAEDPQLILDVAEAVYSIWQPMGCPINIHLPATVDYQVSSYYADCIEWFNRNFIYRKDVTISLFAKNNRGNANALIELGLLAGADRVEGTLLGLGERAGNNDIIVNALNLQSLNIPPHLTFPNMDELIETLKHCMRTTIPIHQPYSGELDFTALAPVQKKLIKEGFEKQQSNVWDIPYFHFNPQDIGRVYEALDPEDTGEAKDEILAKLVNHYGFNMPRLLGVRFSANIKEQHGNQYALLEPNELRAAFLDEYNRHNSPIQLIAINYEKATLEDDEEKIHCQAQFKINGEEKHIQGDGYGALDTLVNAIKEGLGFTLDIAQYHQHPLNQGSHAMLMTYIRITREDRVGYWGVGLDHDNTLAGIKALLNALNRSLQLADKQ